MASWTGGTKSSKSWTGGTKKGYNWTGGSRGGKPIKEEETTTASVSVPLAGSVAPGTAAVAIPTATPVTPAKPRNVYIAGKGYYDKGGNLYPTANPDFRPSGYSADSQTVSVGKFNPQTKKYEVTNYLQTSDGKLYTKGSPDFRPQGAQGGVKPAVERKVLLIQDKQGRVKQQYTFDTSEQLVTSKADMRRYGVDKPGVYKVQQTTGRTFAQPAKVGNEYQTSTGGFSSAYDQAQPRLAVSTAYTSKTSSVAPTTFKSGVDTTTVSYEAGYSGKVPTQRFGLFSTPTTYAPQYGEYAVRYSTVSQTEGAPSKYLAMESRASKKVETTPIYPLMKGVERVGNYVIEKADQVVAERPSTTLKFNIEVPSMQYGIPTTEKKEVYYNPTIAARTRMQTVGGTLVGFSEDVTQRPIAFAAKAGAGFLLGAGGKTLTIVRPAAGATATYTVAGLGALGLGAGAVQAYNAAPGEERGRVYGSLLADTTAFVGGGYAGSTIAAGYMTPTVSRAAYGQVSRSSMKGTEVRYGQEYAVTQKTGNQRIRLYDRTYNMRVSSTAETKGFSESGGLLSQSEANRMYFGERTFRGVSSSRGAITNEAYTYTVKSGGKDIYAGKLSAEGISFRTSETGSIFSRQFSGSSVSQQGKLQLKGFETGATQNVISGSGRDVTLYQKAGFFSQGENVVRYTSEGGVLTKKAPTLFRTTNNNLFIEGQAKPATRTEFIQGKRVVNLEARDAYSFTTKQSTRKLKFVEIGYERSPGAKVDYSQIGERRTTFKGGRKMITSVASGGQRSNVIQVQQVDTAVAKLKNPATVMMKKNIAGAITSDVIVGSRGAYMFGSFGRTSLASSSSSMLRSSLFSSATTSTMSKATVGSTTTQVTTTRLSTESGVSSSAFSISKVTPTSPTPTKPSFTNVTSFGTISTTPSVPGFSPFFGRSGGGGKKRESFSFFGQKKGYTASAFATFAGIKGKKPKKRKFTGFEIRPLIG